MTEFLRSVWEHQRSSAAMTVRGEIYVLTSNWRNCAQRFFLIDSEYTFGAKDCDVTIARFGVADRHAKIVIDQTGTVSNKQKQQQPQQITHTHTRKTNR